MLEPKQTLREHRERVEFGPKRGKRVRSRVQVLVAMMLLMCIPLGRRQVPAQFLRRSARTVAGGVALDTPPLSQRACVYRIEAKLVQQMSYRGFDIFVVTSDDQRAAILRASWLSVSSKVSGINMVEGLDDLRAWQMGLQEF